MKSSSGDVLLGVDEDDAPTVFEDRDALHEDLASQRTEMSSSNADCACTMFALELADQNA